MSKPTTTCQRERSEYSTVLAWALLLMRTLLVAALLATTASRSFGNFNLASAPRSFGNNDPAIAPSSFGNFHLAPTPAASPDLPGVATEFVWHFSVAQTDDDSPPYCDTS